MSKPLSLRLGALALAGLLLPSLTLPGFVAPAAAAAPGEHYMVLGLPFFPPYRVSIANLEINDGKVKGALLAPPGDTRAPQFITGTLVDGKMKITIGKGNDAYDLTLEEDTRGTQEVWQEAVVVPDLDDVTFFRPQSGFSDAAVAIQHMDDQWCGLVYGGLSVALRPSDLRAMADAPDGLADLNVVVSAGADGPKTLKLKQLWNRLRLAAKSGSDNVVFDVSVPLGSEARVAEVVRSLPAVAAVSLPNACREMALANIPRDKVMEGDQISDAKLKSYLEGALSRLLSGQAPDNSGLGPRKFKLADVKVERNSTNAPVFSATVTADSEASRLEKGHWDAFKLAIQPVVTATDTADTISLVPTISDVTGAKKTGAQIPAASAFKPEEDPLVSAAIAHQLVSWLAASEASRCSFLTQTGFDEPEKSFGCTNSAIDDVARNDDN